jgi:subtilisin family serine protease
VSTASLTGYDDASGTSLSAPLVAGLAALVLEAHPKWNVRQLYDAIRNTSSQASHPDNLTGYGIPNAIRAINYVSYRNSNIQIQDLVNFPNPGNGNIQISFKSLLTSSFSIQIYDALGRYVFSVAANEPVTANQIVVKSWNEKNTRGMQVSSGVYFYRVTMAGESITEKILLVK